MRLWCSIAASLLLAACDPAVDNPSAASPQQNGPDSVRSAALAPPSRVVAGPALTYGSSVIPLVVEGGEYGWLQFGAQLGDTVTVRVATHTPHALPTLFLLDDSGQLVAASDSHGLRSGDPLTATLAAGVFHIAVGDDRRQRATFSVDLAGSGLFDCAAASDCVAVPEATCCPHGMNVAVNVDAVSRYDAAYACVTPPRVCPFFQVVDRRLPDCELTTHQCILVEPPGGQP